MKAKLTVGIAHFSNINQMPLEELTIWTILFFSIGVIGVFFSLVINLRNKREVQSCVMIGAYMLLHSFFNMHLSLHLFDIEIDISNCLFIMIVLTFLNEPLLYLYFKRISEKRHLQWRDILHGVPIMFFLAHWLFDSTAILDAIYYKLITLLIYTFLVFKIYKRKISEKRKSELELTIWLRDILIIQVIFICTYFLVLLTWLNLLSNFFALYSLLFSSSLMILYVAYTAYMKPDIFSRSYLFKEGTFFKYKKSGLTDGYSEELRSQLQVLFERDKIYRNSSLSLEDLSEELETTRHNVSQVINEHFEMNFFQYVNKYRIKEAVHIFEESNYNDLKFINIAYDVGFNNKVTFNKAFKAEMKMTPTVFIDKMKRKQSKMVKRK